MKTKCRKLLLFALKLLDVVSILLINVKMQTIVGILTFISRINSMLNCAVHGNSFKTSTLTRLWLLFGPTGGLPVGFLLLRYSVLFTVESLFLLYLLFIS